VAFQSRVPIRISQPNWNHCPRAALQARRLALIWALLCAAPFSAAHAGVFDDIFGKDDAKNWVEQATVLPAPPADSDLIAFFVSSASDFRFAIDQKSLSIGSDGVVRYTLIATSDQGARNITYEGIRCDTREYKIYAFGDASGKLTERYDPVWKRIDEAAANRQRAALFKDYLCPSGVPARVKEIVATLKQNPYNSIPQ
jgi:hypothetical protein